MKIAIAALLCCTFAPAQDRSPGPPFKGVEMSSWKPAGKDWHFNFLPGTNRMKRPEERRDMRHTVVGLAEAKKKISALPAGDNLFWGTEAGTRLPPEVVEEIRALCRRLDIRLHGPAPE